ncbi:copper resistance CopC family protein [Nocardioides sp. YIM 152588]|uniref:copper resistance CopC family protein n=1 Tax=Nocardioides sp. YIM 152588 TaxID=3158259 RepID=UPI0032E50254
MTKYPAPVATRAAWAAPLAVMTALLGVLLAGWTSPAAAHTSLLGSSPEDGARLDALPAEMTFTFSEPIATPAYAVVTAPDGEQVASETVRVGGTEVSVDLAGSGAEGTYTAAFRVVSEDGHPVTGQLTFVVGDEDGGVAASPSPDASASPEASASPAAGAAADGADGADDADASDTSDGSGLSRTQLYWGVGIGLFVVAGVLALLARRARS